MRYSLMRNNAGKTYSKREKNEKGAAMIIVLMIALLLLVATSGVLLQASMHSANVTDATAEQQAYSAAESGLQTALDVLRGNTVPSPLLNEAKPAAHADNRISFSKAFRLDDSNAPDDTSVTPRLSRWIEYDYTPPGQTNPDRSTIGSESYTPLTGNAFGIEVIDPDNPQKLISLDITGSIDGGGNSKTFGTLLSSATIKYNSSTQAGVDVSIREVGIDLGNFTITTSGLGGGGAWVPVDTRFQIKVQMTAPFKATTIIRGTIKAGYIGPNSINGVRIQFDSSIHLIMGSVVTLPPMITPNPPSVNGGKTDLSVTITITEPIRLLIRSTGFGPRGARKTLEMMVKKDPFNGGLIPATLTLVGNTLGSVFDPGLVNNLTTFSGLDAHTGRIIPPIGTTSSSGLTGILSTILCGGSCNLNLIGNPSSVSEELPDFLKSPAKLNTTLEDLKAQAVATNRFYASGETPPNFGNNADGKGLTFVDGDTILSGAGGGVLVVTGKLVLKDDFDFNGVIIVTGRDGVTRQGGGIGTLQGNLVVAPILKSDLSAGFLSPKFDTSGGGLSTLNFNASLDLTALSAGNIVVLGVAEK
jgi:hypothetical protein